MGRKGQAAGFNTALRVMLDEADMTNTALALAVVLVGAEEGIHVGTNTTAIRRMLDGSQPHWPVPRLVAKALSRRLRREVDVAACGFADRAPVTEDVHDGLSCAGTLDGTVRTVAKLSGRDMNRRKFLLGSSFSAAAFSQPALFALTVPPVESTARRGGGVRVGMAEVALLTDQVTNMRQLDFRYGAAAGLREQVVVLVHHEANQLLHASYSDKTGRALLTAVAQATKLAGFTAADVGRHALAQRYLVQALDLAMAAGDRRYAADVLSAMSRITAQIGQNALTEHDRLQHGRQAVALARAGLTVTQGTATPVQTAELHALEARGFALLGDTREAHRAMLAAQRCYESMCPDDEPPWLRLHYTEAAFAADLGKCLCDLGEAEEAIKQSTIAVRDYEPWQVRPRCFAQTDLVAAHLLGRDFEQAAASGRAALRTAAEVRSTRALDRLSTLQRQIKPLRTNSPHLRELDGRITTLLTRSDTHRNETFTV